MTGIPPRKRCDFQNGCTINYFLAMIALLVFQGAIEIERLWRRLIIVDNRLNELTFCYHNNIDLNVACCQS